MQEGDWLLNVEGEDLIGVPVLQAHKALADAMTRWSVSMYVGN